MKNNNISSKNLLFLYRYPKVLEDKEETTKAMDEDNEEEDSNIPKELKQKSD